MVAKPDKITPKGHEKAQEGLCVNSSQVGGFNIGHKKNNKRISH